MPQRASIPSAREAVASLPVGTKLIASDDLDLHLTQGSVTIYTTTRTGLIWPGTNIPYPFTQLSKKWRYTVIESAAGEVYYAPAR